MTTLHIKNMVCPRCETAVHDLMERNGLHVAAVRLGEVRVEETLTESFHLSGTGLTGRHFGKVGVHTAVPAAITHYAMACIIVTDVIALTGRTYECTSTAAKT